MPSEAAPQYRHYRAPRTDNTALVEPPLAELSTSPPCLGTDVDFFGTSLTELRQQARRDLLAAAVEYTSAYRHVPQLASSEPPLLLTGHQAELFHPGVWFKNFMLDRLAAARQGVGIHLVIDTDGTPAPSIRVPTGSTSTPRVENIAYDKPGPRSAVELRRVLDEAVFRSFGERAAGAIAPLVDEPIVRRWWPTVVKAAARTSGNLGLAIAQARHTLEAAWGLETLELPMSRCCGLPAFYQFAAWMLLHAAAVRDAYNAALAAYRQAHGLRNAAQPMPDLTADDDWLETPFWIYREDAPARRAVFARRVGDELQLTNRGDWEVALSINDMPAGLEQLAQRGLKLRTRALSTTLLARLLLGDLFLHGIGGAKYDEVTDDLARRLWGCPPPPYLTLSATLKLPIEHPEVTEADLATLQSSLRDIHWHPETWLPNDPSPAALAAAKQKARWVATSKTPDNASERHQQIAASNATLREEVACVAEQLADQQARATQQHRAGLLLDSREYAFCLFPADNLRARMASLVAGI